MVPLKPNGSGAGSVGLRNDRVCYEHVSFDGPMDSRKAGFYIHGTSGHVEIAFRDDVEGNRSLNRDSAG